LIYHISKGLIQQKIDKKIIIFNEDKSLLFTLNETAAFIFQQIKKGTPANEIATNLAKHYLVSEISALSDVEKTIKSLVKKGFLIEAKT